jgi:hypothetical protein
VCRALANVVDVRAKGVIGVVQLARMPDRRLRTQMMAITVVCPAANA